MCVNMQGVDTVLFLITARTRILLLTTQHIERTLASKVHPIASLKYQTITN